MYCTYCGKEHDDQAVMCPSCGHPNQYRTVEVEKLLFRKGEVLEYRQKRNLFLIGILTFSLYFILQIVFALGLSFLFQFSENDAWPNVVIQLLTVLTLVAINFKFLKHEFRLFLNHAQRYILYAFSGWGIMFICAIIAGILVLIFGGNDQSVNQQTIQGMASQSPLLIFILVVIVAPIMEELVFRKALFEVVRFRIPFILISGLIFGFLHVIQFGDYVNAIPYVSMGLVLASMYVATRNLYVTITIHFLQNFFAFIVIMMTI